MSKPLLVKLLYMYYHSSFRYHTPFSQIGVCVGGGGGGGGEQNNIILALLIESTLFKQNFIFLTHCMGLFSLIYSPLR